MASDIRLDNNSVILDGDVAVDGDLTAGAVSAGKIIVSAMEGHNLGGGPLPVTFKSGISLSSSGIAGWQKFALTTKDDKLVL
jgi:hypothetical protein